MEDNGQKLYERFDCLIARHCGLIDRLCMRYAFGDASRCAELRQDCYLSLWHHLPKLRADANPFHEKAWVAWHCRSVFSHLRYRRRTHLLLPLDADMADTLAEPDNSHLRDTLDRLAVHLTPHERRAFYLMADGCSADELAREFGIAHRSAVMLRHRIIEKLRQAAGAEDNGRIATRKQKPANADTHTHNSLTH